MSIPPAFIIGIAAVALIFVTTGIACIYGRKVKRRQVTRRQDTEKGIKVAAPTLRVPPPAKHPKNPRVVMASRADGFTRTGPLPITGAWI